MKKYLEANYCVFQKMRNQYIDYYVFVPNIVPNIVFDILIVLSYLYFIK